MNELDLNSNNRGKSILSKKSETSKVQMGNKILEAFYEFRELVSINLALVFIDKVKYTV